MMRDDSSQTSVSNSRTNSQIPASRKQGLEGNGRNHQLSGATVMLSGIGNFDLAPPVLRRLSYKLHYWQEYHRVLSSKVWRTPLQGFSSEERL